MMSRKASHLYDRMQHGIAQKSKKVEALQKKREEIEGKQRGAGSKSVLKQKVERLKKEVQRQSATMETMELERIKSNNPKPPHHLG